MLEKEIKRKIEGKLESLEESLKYEIEALCEHLATVHELMMLYYWDNKQKLSDMDE